MIPDNHQTEEQTKKKILKIRDNTLLEKKEAQDKGTCLQHYLDS